MKKKKAMRPAKKAAVKKAAARKPVAKKAAAKPAVTGKKPAQARPAVSPDGGGASPAPYAPQPIQGIGWKPFRYPPQ